jgi:hypothetical protein
MPFGLDLAVAFAVLVVAGLPGLGQGRGLVMKGDVSLDG